MDTDLTDRINQVLGEVSEKITPELKESAVKTKSLLRKVFPDSHTVIVAVGVGLLTRKLLKRSHIPVKFVNAQLANDFALAKGDFTTPEGGLRVIQFGKGKG